LPFFILVKHNGDVSPQSSVCVFDIYLMMADLDSRNM